MTHLTCGPIVLDTDALEVCVGARPAVRLTPHLSAVLAALLDHKGKLVSPYGLMQHAGVTSVMSAIAQLRRIIPELREMLVSVWGGGYILTDPCREVVRALTPEQWALCEGVLARSPPACAVADAEGAGDRPCVSSQTHKLAVGARQSVGGSFGGGG